jgi:hypothetical protein
LFFTVFLEVRDVTEKMPEVINKDEKVGRSYPSSPPHLGILSSHVNVKQVLGEPKQIGKSKHFS